MGQSLRYLPGQGKLLHPSVALHGSERAQCHYLASVGLPSTLPILNHFIHFPNVTGTLLAVVLVVIPRVGGFAYVLSPQGPFKRTLLRNWQFLSLLQFPQVFTARGNGALSFQCWNPGLCGLACGWDHYS